jgi:hypothetical protein
MTPNLRNYARTATLILTLALSSCAAQSCRQLPRPAQDAAPPPLMFSRCLTEILMYGQSSPSAPAPISQSCLDFLRSERTK